MDIIKLLKMSEKNLLNHISPINNGLYFVTKLHKNPCPLICVHLDTVCITHPLFIQKQYDIVTAPGSNCLGADDRAGVWIALEMMKRGTVTDFEYGFFCGEESGCIGSTAYGKTRPNHTCYIGLDRGSKGGKQNIATYGCNNEDLLSCFPYPESIGTVSDCSVLADLTGKSCVNVSVGYQFEHTSKELLDLSQMTETRDLMLQIDIPAVDYESEYKWIDDTNAVLCDFCGKHELLYKYGKYNICKQCERTIEYDY